MDLLYHIKNKLGINKYNIAQYFIKKNYKDFIKYYLDFETDRKPIYFNYTNNL